MLNRCISSFFIIFLLSCSHQTLRNPSASESTLPPTTVFEMVHYPYLDLNLRAGYALETTSLKGCVLYLQGLADSIKNHNPYFSQLNAAGYRVIYFDYMGQGGSEGKMNNTRVQVGLPLDATPQMLKKYHKKDKYYEIPQQGEFIWDKYKDIKNNLGQDCNQSPKLVVGWSTGGLSAYRMAYEKKAHAVILIAPGIHPKWMVGEAAGNWDKMIFLQQTITVRTLTRNRFIGTTNPHIDPIKPKSPAHVPQFAGNLIGIASEAKHWNIDSSIAGIVFLSGLEDTYVDREATINTLTENAPHFEVKSYDGALHELDNEIPEVAQDLYEQSIRFLDAVVKK